MKRHSRRTITVSTSHEDEEGRETDIEVEANFTPGSPAYFSKSFGNYLPGDSAEVEIISATDVYEIDWTERLLADKAWLGRVEDEIAEAAAEEARWGDDDRAHDEMRDRRAEGR